ncbi:hypothetical protein PSU4_28510 [Pseudonocardia sulfidoxydans NBRC 16205]|uniref:Uncharacterized protein n=1 Tax=Pseudonocardia sulfidoxydans NBRC 16205 TaxID=1223511 RepID=A0A511DHB1_9PSEU|nr:hypothetical protein PSU4_28510 [Pseudonocardia sulfidoxydans NBRC 16205]
MSTSEAPTDRAVRVSTGSAAVAAARRSAAQRTNLRSSTLLIGRYTARARSAVHADTRSSTSGAGDGGHGVARSPPITGGAYGDTAIGPGCVIPSGDKFGLLSSRSVPDRTQYVESGGT